MDRETIRDSLRKLETLTEELRPLIKEMPERLEQYRYSNLGDPSEAVRYIVSDIIELRCAVDGLTRVVLHSTQSPLLKQKLAESLDQRKWPFARW